MKQIHKELTIEEQHAVTQNHGMNPCEGPTEDDEPCPFEGSITVHDICLGIPIQYNLCSTHYAEWKEMREDEENQK